MVGAVDDAHLHDNGQIPGDHRPELLHRKLETAIARDEDGATARTRRRIGLLLHLPEGKIGA